MNASLIAADVVAFSAQVACVVAVAAIASLLVRIDAASVRYQYWRAVLMLCLMLPWLQGRQPTGAAGESIGTAVLSVTAISATTTPAASMATDRLPWYALSVWIIVGVIGLRVARLGLGLFRLRRLRRSGRPAGPNAEHDDLQRALGTRAEIRYVPGEQPVTCGMWRPVVLLPETLPSHPPAIQRAVLTHELLHVQRRDWLWLTSEEMLRAVLWFHPAIWWLVGRVRLAREEVVDELTVLSTGQRRAYLEALLAFADAAPVVPAAAFARRHHLFRRITLISKEAVMSSKRIVVSAVVLAAAVIAGTWYSVNAFPMLQAPGTIRAVPQAAVTTDAEPGPLERTAKPITPENPIPRRTYAVSPKSPVADIDSGAVLVTLRLTLNGLGRIAEVRLVGRGTARMGWSTAPDGRGRGAMVAGVVGGLAPAPEAFVTAAAEAVRQWIYDPPADAPIAFDVTFEFSSGAGARLVAHGGPAAVRFMPAPPPPPLPPAPGTTTALNWAPGAVRVGGNILPPTKVKDVAPVYPPIAQTARVQGVVILESLIGADGRVQDARILRSIPLLDQAALDAVKQWEFTPTMLNGQPAPVIMTITVQFTLTQ